MTPGRSLLAWAGDPVPDPSPWWEAFGVADYHTAIALFATTMPGGASGLVGTFLVLRREALASDTLSHSTLPGVGLVFLILASFGLPPRNLPLLLLGGLASAGLAAVLVVWVRTRPRMRNDTALAIVLGSRARVYGCNSGYGVFRE